ncbi:hypothetical protein F5879DRAFT_998812 [Lentinula edodes]|nr:hypothetical protein F5879DRAFT_998812 [Lentinula edodes]
MASWIIYCVLYKSVCTHVLAVFHFDFIDFILASAMCSSTTTVAPLHNTMGALLIGVLISCALWGISTAQTYIYFSTFYHHDTLRLKSLVVFIFVLDTAHQAMLSHSIYIYLVSNFGDVEYLEVVEHTSHGFAVGSHRCDHPTVHVLAHLDLYDCFCFILPRLTDGLFVGLVSNKSTYWSIPIIIVVFASFAITMVYFEKSWSLRTWTKLADLSKISRAVNGLNFGGDITITFVMVYFLRTSRSGIKRTDALMNRLMYFCLKTGLLTTYVIFHKAIMSLTRIYLSFCAILSLISISIWPNTFIYITFYCALARLYANSFLATLNARDQLRKSNRPLGSSLFSNPTLSGLEWARAMASDTVITSSDIPKSCTNPLSIKQEVETHIHHDIELDNLAAKSLSSILPA